MTAALQPTVVLVHGAYHGAWCWDGVRAALEAQGVASIAVDLPGHGEDPGEQTDLHGDAAAVTLILDALPPPVILVGHSYGGAVITEAGVHPAVTHLVYLAAFVPDLGESSLNAAAEEVAAEHLDHSGRPDPREVLTIRDGFGRVSAEGATAMFYTGAPPEVVRAAAARMQPQRMANFRESPAAVAWRAKPSTYAVCSADLAIHPHLQAILARRCTASVSWPSGHIPMASHPDLVTDLLVGIARTS
ncbi:MAG: alpha/beta fold hydrolase [Sporichthyaceae bacterium]